MNKNIVLLMLPIFLTASVAACFCSETDDGVNGWFDRYYQVAPAGCEKTGVWTGECQDQCVGTTYRDFDCNRGYIKWTDTANDQKCAPPGIPSEDVPEFTTIGAGVALLGAGYIIRKRRNA